MIRKKVRPPRNLVLVMGDQLDGQSAAFDGFDPVNDIILMMELREEADNIPQNKRRIAFFFAAMRHFCEEQRALGRTVLYSELDEPGNVGSFAGEVQRRFSQIKPDGAVIVLEPGDYRVRESLEALDLPIQFREDRHFLCSREDFVAMREEQPTMILETFYRAMRVKHDILMNGDKPVGGQWNFDKDNRKSFGRNGPPLLPPKPTFKPDEITGDVLALVERCFPDNPGSLARFDLPVTREHALQALDDFVRYRLPEFGRYQDAMAGGQPFLFHSVLSGPLNLHLLNPREVLDAVLDNPSNAPLNAVEGFVRQVLGWREWVRGIYWHLMPDYAERNALDADLPVPRFYWTGETDMRCLAEAIGHTIHHAYAHHIERLMVLGQFCLLLGVRPYDVHRWHMSMFWDAIDWVSLPNTLGMSQHGDGGVMGTKPYCASGAYIDRMSDHCGRCRYDPQQSIGDRACPFTTLYWDFLARHQERLAGNTRMRGPFMNLARKDPEEMQQIRDRAVMLRETLTAETFLPEPGQA
ncbi:cryptochrome/photolyase family protein [Tianweitania populi]|uniref:Cryptochrome/photolyase family protein n=1 Tax=Tianweitania populi TaxID=1607949 RepID=A0A8J3GKA5_9HYPH|nr:cryptochrome/photolyase family protein [Tianweitania populi]GHD16236.1 cryptochrome/photolyase family protein [Tianweitania populi]